MKNRIQRTLQWSVCGLLLAGAGTATSAEYDAEELTKQANLAITDLAERAGVEIDEITVRSAAVVSWGSGAVGCPKKGMNYTQAIVPGMLVLLEADGVVYRYHGSTGGNVFYCPDSRATAPAYGSGEQFM